MKYGVIDLGTNSMRLLLAEYEDSKFTHREKHINTTRLGSGIDSNGNITKEAMERNINSLAEFKQIALEYGCNEVLCIGTAALRTAKNKDEFIKLAREVADVDVKVISGEMEAFLGYKGVIGGLNHLDDNALIIDIGGGSTEFIVGNSKEIIYRKSIDVGALMLTNKFVKKFPETDEEISTINEYIESLIDPIISKIKSLEKSLMLIGIGGTITSVSAIFQELETYSMEKIHSSKVTSKEVERQISQIRKLNIEERRQIKGLQPKRAEIILSGELILKCIMDKLDLNEVVVSEYDNLEGSILV